MVWYVYKCHGISDSILVITARHNKTVSDIPPVSFVPFIMDFFNFCKVLDILWVLNKTPHKGISETKIIANFLSIFRIVYNAALMQQGQRNPSSWQELRNRASLAPIRWRVQCYTEQQHSLTSSARLLVWSSQPLFKATEKILLRIRDNVTQNSCHNHRPKV